MRHMIPLVYASSSTPCLSTSLNMVWSIDDMLMGFFSSFSSLLGFGSFQDFQNSYVIPLCPVHLPAWDYFSASCNSSIDVSASSSFDSSSLSFSLICFFILFIALILVRFIGGFFWSDSWYLEAIPTILLFSVWTVPPSSCSPSIIFAGSFGLFRANQYLEHCSPSFIKCAWADILALSILFSPILFREFLRKISSSLAFSLFGSVTFFDDTLLLWVSMSLLRSFTLLFAFFFPFSAVIIVIFFISSFSAFHFDCGFFPSLLRSFISCAPSHCISFSRYSCTHLSQALSFFSDI